MKTKNWAILLIVLCTLFISAAQVMYKLGSRKLEFSIGGILLNYLIIGGLVLYGIGALCMIVSFKGGDVSILYPILGTSYIWVALASWLILSETMNVFKILGITSIIIGVVFIGRNS